jgi:ribose transport system permease protein
VKLLRGPRSIGQQEIVFVVFVLIFGGFALLLPGFRTASNMLGLLQNVAILGVLGLGMAIVVIGRGIDISMVAVMAVPAGLVLQMVQDGYSLPVAFGSAVALALAFGLANGWLIAYAEVPSLFTTLASGLFLAGLGQVALFRLDIVQWSPQLDPFAWIGRDTLAGVPMPVIVFGAVALLVSFFLRKTRLGAFVYAVGDNPFGARTSGSPTRPVIVLQYVLAALIGMFAGLKKEH